MNAITQSQPTDVTAATAAAPHKIGMSELLLDLKATAPQDYQALSNFIHSMDEVLKPDVVGEVFKESAVKTLLTAKLAIASVDNGYADLQQAKENGTLKFDLPTLNKLLEGFHAVTEEMGGAKNFSSTLNITGAFDKDKLHGFSGFVKKLSTLPENTRNFINSTLTPNALIGLNNMIDISKELDTLKTEKEMVSGVPHTTISEAIKETRLVETQSDRFR
jgi:hypothetical protein